MRNSIYPIVMLFAILLSCEEKEVQVTATPAYDTLFTLHDYESTGVEFANMINEQPLMNIFMYQYYHNGAGLAIGDFDNDGLVDLYFSGNFGRNRLYKNLGDFKFQDVTDSSKAEGSYGWSTGVSIVDINNDGLLDIYLSKSGNFEVAQRRNELFINQGGMRFKEMASEYGLDDAGYSNQAAFFDYDLDGDLDVYVMNHPVIFDNDANLDELQNKKDDYGSDHLYENQNGKYVDVSEKAGLANNSIGYGLGLSIADFNNDMYPDIYIGNDFLERDYLYINNQNGTFRDVLKDATRHISNFSMGNDAADFNNDGYLDIFVADMAAEDNYRSKTNMSGMNPERFWKAVDEGLHHQYMINTLQMNNGDLTFSEIAQLAGIDKTDWSWSALFADFDMDGWKDLFVTNGLRKESRNNDFVRKKKEMFQDISKKSQGEQFAIIKQLLDMMPTQKIPNYIYRNKGDLTFEKMSDKWNFNQPSFSNGAAYADLDNDGDLDIVINNIDDAAFIYENNSAGAHYLKLKFEGPDGNRRGQGVKAILESNGKRQYAEHYSTRGYLSSMEDGLHFGLGESPEIDRLIVIWPDGKTQEFGKIMGDREMLISHIDADKKTSIADYIKNPEAPEEIGRKHGIDIIHRESEYDDYEKQVLLPHEMSKLGPCLCVADVNSDGLEDFLIGGAAGYPAQLMIQQSNGEFTMQEVSDFQKDKGFEDTGCTFFDSDNDGDLDLYLVSGSSEFGISGPMYQDRLYINTNDSFKRSMNTLPEISISGSFALAFDLEGDGDQDIFIAVRQIPEQYPMPGDAMILVNEDGKFDLLEKGKGTVLGDLGMLTDAFPVDYNSDGLTDILVTGEWMPLTFLIQDESGFNSKVEIPNSLGWWNFIHPKDMNGDGKEDYVLGNLGLNIKYKASQEEPFFVYAKDFDENGTFDIVLSSSKGESRFPVRGRQCSSEQVPEIKEKFPTYDLFAKATVEEIYSKEELQNALKYEAVHFENSILYSGKEGFELKKLPNYAQISAGMDALSYDVDENGEMDLILVGNLEEMEVETPRADASHGILLLQKNGEFHSDPAYYNLGLSGNVRAASEINVNGKKCIIVARNNGKLSLIRRPELK